MSVMVSLIHLIWLIYEDVFYVLIHALQPANLNGRLDPCRFSNEIIYCLKKSE